MRRKGHPRRPGFKCPHCGSDDTRIALWGRDNLSKALLLAVLFPLEIAWGARFDRVCRACKQRIRR